MYRPPAVSFQRKLARLSKPPGAAFGPSTAGPAEVVAPSPSLEPSPSASPFERGTTLDDLRARMAEVLARTTLPKEAPRPPPVDGDDLPFATRETPHGPLSIRVQRLSPAHRLGRAPLLPARSASASLLSLLALDPSLAACSPKGALYLDTETTGLHGGTGTIAFLLGLAFWEGDTGGLVLEQLLVRNLGEEAPMLAHVAMRIEQASMLVTFNGKSFDLPLLRTRFVMAKLPAPVEPPHLDLVHVARRLHRHRAVACKLTTLEREVLGFERQDDVPSGEVSQVYLHFLRTGDARALLGVVEHNAWDVLAMAALLGLYGEPLEGSQLTPDDLVGVASTLKRAGAVDHAYEVATHAIHRGAGEHSFRARAEIAKARGDRARALEDFERFAATVDDPKVRLELAKLYEHFVRSPGRALAVLEGGTSEPVKAAGKRAARLSWKVAEAARLEREALPLLAMLRKDDLRP